MRPAGTGTSLAHMLLNRHACCLEEGLRSPLTSFHGHWLGLACSGFLHQAASPTTHRASVREQ